MSGDTKCNQCGGPKGRAFQAGLFCLPCANERKRRRISATPKQTHPGLRPLKIGDNLHCRDCRIFLRKAGGTRAQLRCMPCAKAHSYAMCVASGQEAARRAVQAAVKSGAIPKAKGLTCVDCGREAHVYDHRDYAKPLDVQPVCVSCNLVRGPAKPIPSPVEA